MSILQGNDIYGPSGPSGPQDITGKVYRVVGDRSSGDSTTAVSTATCRIGDILLSGGELVDAFPIDRGTNTFRSSGTANT